LRHGRVTFAAPIVTTPGYAFYSNSSYHNSLYLWAKYVSYRCFQKIANRGQIQVGCYGMIA